MKKSTDEKEPAFKVVDKRRFDDEGQERPEAFVPESPKSEAPKPPEVKTPQANEQQTHERPVDFSMFVQTLAHQAMMGLGIVPWPDSKIIKQDLNLARETIDLLDILKNKTAGNLDKDEEALLTGLLYQLRVAFVEISQEPQGGKSDPGSIIT